MAGMKTRRSQKMHSKMAHGWEYRKKKDIAMIFSYGCEETGKVKHIYINGYVHQSVPDE